MHLACWIWHIMLTELTGSQPAVAALLVPLWLPVDCIHGGPPCLQGAVINNTRLSFVMRVLSKNTTHISIGLCRFSATRETACVDGRDNDCDGLTDSADPDCRGRVPPAPPALCNRNAVCEPPRYAELIRCGKRCLLHCHLRNVCQCSEATAYAGRAC
jgi:hypothetical protein